MSEFQTLLDELSELDELRKAQKPAHPEPDGDEQPDGKPSDQDEDNEDEKDEDEDEDEDQDEEPEGKPFGKSFRVSLADGSEVDAVDGTAVIAALQADVASVSSDLLKAFKSLTSLVKSQQEDLSALRTQVDDLGRRPAGRKSVLNVHEKPSPVPEAAPAVPPTAVLAKALLAQRAGRLHGGQVAEIEMYLSHGKELPPHLARALD
jgi:hypothetical protein